MYGRVSNQQAVQHQQAVPRVSFFGTYLGAHEDHPASASGVFLTVMAGGVLVHREAQREFRKQPAMPAQQLVYAPWSEVRDLEVDGTSTSKTHAVLPCGPGRQPRRQRSCLLART
jgi:hypothetical protein